MQFCIFLLKTTEKDLTAHLQSLGWLSTLYATSLRTKSTIHQVTTMLATSENALPQDHNHLLTAGTVELTLWLLPEHYTEGD